MGAHGRGVTAALLRREYDVVAVDDRQSDSLDAFAAERGIDLHIAPGADELGRLLASATGFVPSPGLPESHPSFAAAAAAGVPTVSEFDLAQEWDDRNFVAVTGTDGKTTVTSMIAEILTVAGQHTIVAGNTEPPLVTAIDDATYDLFVVEASSFRLAHSSTFRPTAAAWLNFGPDHLDVHASLDTYELAKASIWARHAGNDVAVANIDDEVVMRHAPAGAETFGLTGGTHCVVDGALSLDGTSLLEVDQLWRTLPHDITNALAAAAIARAAGASPIAIAEGLRGFRGLPHRVELVGERDGIRWYNDSKATTPHAVAAAVGGFESVVLIAGGRNKGLDLSSMAEHQPVHAVVATGDATDEIVAAFAGGAKVVTADSMEAAVAAAAELARTGDAVVLSPGCTSYDWYANYGERGEHFTSLVRDYTGRTDQQTDQQAGQQRLADDNEAAGGTAKDNSGANG